MAADADGVMMQSGKTMMMGDAKAMGPMQSDMTMSHGTKVARRWADREPPHLFPRHRG